MDYRDFKVKTKGCSSTSSSSSSSSSSDKKPTSRAWWRAPEGERHKSVFAAVQHLRQKQAYRSQDNLRHMRLYGGMPALGFRPGSYARAQTTPTNPDGYVRLQMNIIESLVETYVSKIGKSRPKATFLTSGGNWSEQRRAKLLDKFVQGQFYEAGVYRWNKDVLRASGVLGMGAAKVFRKDWRVYAEPVLIEEILVDDAEAIYGKPRTLYQTKVVSREVLLGDPDCASRTMQAAIKKAASVEDLDRRILPMGADDGDMVDIVEAWHLPSGPKKRDGRHVISVNTTVLFEEDWQRDCFPFAFLPYAKRLLGFYGKGIAEKHTGRQLAINRTLKRIDEILHLCSVPRILVEDSSRTPITHIRNVIGDILKYRGKTPELWAQNAVPPELFLHLGNLVREAYELEGISQMAANAKKPAGLDSAPSLREFNDIEDTRLVAQGQSWEDFHLDLARLFVEETRCLEMAAKEAKKNGDEVPEYSVTFPFNKRGIEELDWEKVKLDEDKYVMQMFPSSSLPTTPSARLAKVQELFAAGFIDAQECRRLLDFPDLEASGNVAFAAFEDIESTVERMLDGGAYEPPEPYQNLELGIARCQSAYLRARTARAPEDILEKLRRWMDQADKMKKKAVASTASGMTVPGSVVPPAAPAPIGPGAAPIGAPPVGALGPPTIPTL